MTEIKVSDTRKGFHVLWGNSAIIGDVVYNPEMPFSQWGVYYNGNRIGGAGSRKAAERLVKEEYLRLRKNDGK
jgi:hypothetical protein